MSDALCSSAFFACLRVCEIWDVSKLASKIIHHPVQVGTNLLCFLSISYLSLFMVCKKCFAEFFFLNLMFLREKKIASGKVYAELLERLWAQTCRAGNEKITNPPPSASLPCGTVEFLRSGDR